jgi:type I restriction-modification system DNA methylase subunit
MAIFQKSVLANYTKSLDYSKIDNAYHIFSKLFFDEKRKLEIQTMKEEEYQDGFLDDLFVSVLGYVKRPNTGYNLVREKKNESDSKKADGAILKNEMPLAVIELKGTDTKDLDKITKQGFNYKNNHKECLYVITSNFEKLRFYIDNAVEYLEFNLMTLSKDDFIILWVCLHPDNLLNNIPAKIKAESVVKEEDITKNLYKDYSTFKQELWQDIVKLNPNGDPLQFYKKTQKLIDRFLFIFFAEDAGLLPSNSISRMVERWNMLKEEDAYKPLYDIFKQYFGYINTGRQGKTAQDEIFAYNGGLMAEDDVLETITISDEVLKKHVLKLTAYDFSSEIDVNILGHIFENSLNDIEAVTAELEGQEIDKAKTKRKKDGVFYTPKYITKYIVENTIGKLCEEKKLELKIIDEEYAKGRTNRKKETLKELDNNLQAYRNWLLKITICDPACGSGAFLNQALEYLMEEHRYIDELESQLLGAGFTFPGVENHILENNIFGVDINEESIEIAKLSLWLRTAQRGRKLTSLNNNIKCGNSLIDDPAIAGKKAFNWQSEFPLVFEKGGFDVIIGNPPYVNARNMNSGERLVLSQKYELLSGAWDLYVPFLLKVNEISKNNCYGWIIPNKLLISDYGKKTLSFLKENGLNKVINISSLPIFENVGVYPIILINNIVSNSYLEYKINNIQNLYNIDDYVVKDNVFIRFKTFKDFNLLINSGATGFEAQSLIPLINEKNEGIDFAVSGSIDPYSIDLKNVPYMKNKFNFPKIKLDSNIIADSKIKFWCKDKIVVAGMTKRLEAYYTEEPLALGVGIYGIYGFSNFSPLFLLAIINSRFLTHYLTTVFKDKHLAGGYLAINKSTIEDLPLVNASEKIQNLLGEKASSIQSLSKELQILSNKFISILNSDFNIEIKSKKIEEFYNLNWSDFEKNLNKNKIYLSGILKEEWFDRFDRLKNQALDIKKQITETNNEIDRIVYELYDLTNEEIQIVEKKLNE